MRYLPGLVLALSVGAAASLYTPSADAAGVYVGVGLPGPVIAAPLPIVSPYYYGYYGPRAWYGPRAYWGYGWGYGRYGYGYGHGFRGGYGHFGYRHR